MDNKSIDFDIISQIARLIQNFNPSEKDKSYLQLFELLKKIIDYTNITLFLVNHEKEKLEIVASNGQPIDLIKLVNFELGNGFSAWVAKEGKTVVLNNLHKPHANGNLVIRSFLSLPLILENELIGVINFGHEKANSFSDTILPKIKIFSPLLAGLLSRNQYIEKLKKQNQDIRKINSELKNAQDQLIKVEQKAAISAMVVSLNHEINNPLMIIQGNIQMISATTNDTKLLKRVNIINNQINRIAELLSKLRKIETPLLEKYVEGDNEKMLNLS